MTRRITLAAVVLALMALPASTEVQSNQWVPIDGWLWDDPCNGEVLQTFGGYHEVISYTEVKGEYRWYYLVNAHATGVGLTSGNEYVFNDSYTFKERGVLGESASWTFTWHTRFVTKGKPTNAYLVFKTHATWSPATGVVVETVKDSVHCSGR